MSGFEFGQGSAPAAPGPEHDPRDQSLAFGADAVPNAKFANATPVEYPGGFETEPQQRRMGDAPFIGVNALTGYDLAEPPEYPEYNETVIATDPFNPQNPNFGLLHPQQPVVQPDAPPRATGMGPAGL